MISAFEYVTVLISIVLGLWVTQILADITDLLRQSNRVKLYWPHLIWVLLVLVMHVQDWWVTYDLKNYQPWRLPTFLFTMLYSVNLFVLARLLFPFGWHEETIDLKMFYEQNYRKIFGFATGSVLLAMLGELFIRNGDLTNKWIKVALPVLMVALITQRMLPKWVHKFVAILFLLPLTLSIAVEWNVWLIT